MSTWKVNPMSQTSKFGGFMSRISGDIWRYCGFLGLPMFTTAKLGTPNKRSTSVSQPVTTSVSHEHHLCACEVPIWPTSSRIFDLGYGWKKNSNTCLAGNPNWLAEKSPKTSINSQTKHDVRDCPKRRRCWCRRASSVISKRSLSQIRCVLTLSEIASSQAAPSGRAFDGWTKIGLQPTCWENKVVDVTVGVG